MAGRKSAKNEIQDPSLPSKKRARWRLIGAGVLATLAVIILPFALESEPRQQLGDVAVKMPPRTELGKMERVLPTGNTVPDSSRVAADSVGKPQLPADRVKPVVIGSQGESVSEVASVSAVALPPVKPLAPVKPATGATGPAVVSSQSIAAAARPASAKSKVAKPAAAKPNKAAPKPKTPPAKVAKAGKPVVKAPPIPKRRTDPNSLKSASPSGYVVQIGAFSSQKSARAQVARGKKLGFDTYTENIKTAKGPRIRVRVGPYLTRKQANAARSKLKQAGIDTALIAP